MRDAPERREKDMHLFRRFSARVARAAGSPWAFCGACVVIAAWACTGPFLGFSDTWQLVANTGTTLITFLMVFVLQNTQNTDSRAIHLKLDEVIASLENASNRVIDAEHLSDEQLRSLWEGIAQKRSQGQEDHP
jgi:low affinity Fe/Cu permease